MMERERDKAVADSLVVALTQTRDIEFQLMFAGLMATGGIFRMGFTRLLHETLRHSSLRRWACTLMGLKLCLWSIIGRSQAEESQLDSQAEPAVTDSTSSSPTNFWSVMHDVQKRCSSSRVEWLGLLSHQSIRDEIGLDDQEYALIRELDRQLLISLKDIHQSQFQQALSHEKLVETVAQKLHDNDLAFTNRLRESADFERLIGILVQARGDRAVIYSDVAERIQLPDDKLDEVRSVYHRAWREQMDLMGDKMRDLLRRGQLQQLLVQSQRQEVRQLFKRAEDKVNHAVALRLTSEQLAALRRLEGKKIELPADFIDFSRGPGRVPRTPSSKSRDRAAVDLQAQ
ncbi:MAG: hypothetical protein KF752_00465 [Pirellulaceae bacterium]|nr:hypothetical protein [Pirellulaceae bacterium]